MSQFYPYNTSKPSYALGSEIQRDWELQANGIPVEDLLAIYIQNHNVEPQRVEWFTASNASLGTSYMYGVHPNASTSKPYDGIWKRERFGGGAVIAVYTEEPETREVYIGTLWQKRMLHNTEQPVLGTPRGFAIERQPLAASSRMTKEDMKQVHLQTALVELKEEMFTGEISQDMIHRLGPPLNTNNADIDTSGEGEGIYFYAVELPWSYLNTDAVGYLALRPEFQANEGIPEGILKCDFRPVREVLDLLDNPDEPTAGCALTEIAIARLTRYLQRKGLKVI